MFARRPVLIISIILTMYEDDANKFILHVCPWLVLILNSFFFLLLFYSRCDSSSDKSEANKTTCFWFRFSNI